MSAESSQGLCREEREEPRGLGCLDGKRGGRLGGRPGDTECWEPRDKVPVRQ